MNETVEMRMDDVVDAMLDNPEIKTLLDLLVGAIEGAGLTRKQDYVYLARLRCVEFSDIADALGVSEKKAMRIWGKAVSKVRGAYIAREVQRWVDFMEARGK